MPLNRDLIGKKYSMPDGDYIVVDIDRADNQFALVENVRTHSQCYALVKFIRESIKDGYRHVTTA